MLDIRSLVGGMSCFSKGKTKSILPSVFQHRHCYICTFSQAVIQNPLVLASWPWSLLLTKLHLPPRADVVVFNRVSSDKFHNGSPLHCVFVDSQSVLSF